MPAATGNAVNAAPSIAMRHCSSPGQMGHEPMSTTVIAQTAAEAVSTHLTRWRSSPRAERSRTTSARTPSASAT